MKFKLSRNKIFIFYPTNSKITEPIFTIFLYDVVQLVKLLMRISARRWCILFENTKAKTEDSQLWRLQKLPKINWLP